MIQTNQIQEKFQSEVKPFINMIALICLACVIWQVFFGPAPREPFQAKDSTIGIQTMEVKAKAEEKPKEETPTLPAKDDVEAKSELELMSKTNLDQEAQKSQIMSRIENYRLKYFPKSPITAEMIYNSSVSSKVPVDFILAVCHNESHCGTKGRAVPTKNAFNVGNVTAGDNKPTDCKKYSNCLKDWQQGLDAFTSLITRCYFNEGEEIKLETWVERDFRATRCNVKGKRYMQDWRAKIKYQERIRNLKTFNL